MAMMHEDDPRVKELQDLAWSIGSISNKPGSKLPEKEKRDAYRVTSRAIDLCSNATYIEEADWLKKAADRRKEVKQMKARLVEVEKQEIERLSGKCYRALSGGGYAVGYRQASATSSSASPVAAASDDASGAAAPPAWTSASSEQAAARSSLTAEQFAKRCVADPLTLRLTDLGLQDCDVDALCLGLRAAGGDLTTLDLSRNSLADAGVQSVVAALAGGACPRLIDLHIADNQIGPLGERVLTEGLAVLRRSIRVNLTTAASPPSSVDSGVSAQEAPSALVGEGPHVASDDGETPRKIAHEAELYTPIGAAQARTAAEATTPAAKEVPAELLPDGSVRVVIPVPESVSSAAQLDLDVGPRTVAVALVNGGASFAKAVLPVAVDAALSKASFSKKRRSLILMLQPVGAVPAAS